MEYNLFDQAHYTPHLHEKFPEHGSKGKDALQIPSLQRSRLLLGRHLTVPNPQEDKNKRIDCERFSVDTKGGIPREQNRELTTT